MRMMYLLRVQLAPLLAIGLLSTLPTVVWAQEASAMLAVRQCDITPTEGGALNAAFAEYVEYAVANMPEMPGTEVAQNLRELGILPDVPLIITTALDELDAQDGLVEAAQ